MNNEAKIEQVERPKDWGGGVPEIYIKVTLPEGAPIVIAVPLLDPWDSKPYEATTTYGLNMVFGNHYL